MRTSLRGFGIVTVVAFVLAVAPSQARADIGMTTDGSTTGVHPIMPVGGGMGMVLDGSATGLHPVMNLSHPAFLDAPTAPASVQTTSSDGATTATWVGVALVVAGVIACGVIASQMQSSYNQQVAQQQAAFNARVQQQ